MNDFVELPLLEPIYSTYHHEGTASSIIVNNPSIRFFYLNEVMNLTCTRKFLSGYTTPEIGILHSSWLANPHLENICFSTQFIKSYTNQLIKELLDNGYYVFFNGVDDYYIRGKSWYKELHQNHNGLICGYNQDDKTFCIYAYDNNWVYQKFWTPQKSFTLGRISMSKKGIYSKLWAIKPKLDTVTFSPEKVKNKISEYLDSSLEKYRQNEEGNVYGIIVHDYIAKYLDKLLDGSIPYNRMDRRVFRVIWEHKKAMLERIEMIEKTFFWDSTFSEKYKSIVMVADNMRMLYASHHRKKRYSVLPVIKKMLIEVMNSEKEILNDLATKLGEELKK